MPLDQAVLDHRVVGGVAAIGGRAAADRRDRRRRPPRHDRRLAEAPARRRPRTGRRRPLRLRHDPGAGRRHRSGRARAERGEPPARQAVLYCNVGDVTNLAVAKGRSCLFTRVSPVGLEDIAGQPRVEHRPEPRARPDVARPRRPRAAGRANRGRPRRRSARPRRRSRHGASALLDELRLSLDFYGAQEGAVPVERVVLCGPGSAIPGLAEQHGAGPRPADRRSASPDALGGLDPAAAARLTLPYGLALEHWMRPVNLIPPRTGPASAGRCERRPARLHRRRRPRARR